MMGTVLLLIFTQQMISLMMMTHFALSTLRKKCKTLSIGFIQTCLKPIKATILSFHGAVTSIFKTPKKDSAKWIKLSII